MIRLFSKKNRPRRVSDDKTGIGSTPVHKHLGKLSRYLAVGFIGLVVVAVVTWLATIGAPPIVHQQGQPSREAVQALVPFEVVDHNATETRRRQARAAVPPAFTRDESVTRANRERLTSTVDRFLSVRTPEELKALDGLSGAPVDSVETWQAVLARGDDIRREVLDTIDYDGDDMPEPVRRVGIIADGHATEGQISFYPTPEATPRDISSMDNAYTVRRLHLDIIAQRLKRLIDKPELAEFLAARLASGLRPDIVPMPEKTEALREQAAGRVEPIYRSYRIGDTIVSRNEIVDRTIHDALKKHQQLYYASITSWRRIQRVVGTAGLVAGALALAGLYLALYRPHVAANTSRVFFLALLLVLSAGLAKGFVLLESSFPVLYGFPMALAPILVAVVYDREFGLGYLAVQAVLVGMIFDARIDTTLALTAGSVAAVWFTRDIRTRSRLAEVGLACGITQFVFTWLLALAEGGKLQWGGLIARSLTALTGGILIGLIISGVLPFVERRFRLLTGIRLLEMGDLNQPLFKKFALEAPGTYNHSITVGSLSESAAQAVGANGLLARVGGYFHDIGKINKPLYFIENIGHRPSKHEKLNSSMSSLVIRAHPKDGVEIVDKMGLPRIIQDLIRQHHGTTMVEFFYKQALREAEAEGADTRPSEEDFRYPGPRPQTTEAAIIMLADAVESATRTLDEPDPAHIENLVEQIAAKRMADGQFDQCPVTIDELTRIRQSLVKSLIAIYHSRIKY